MKKKREKRKRKKKKDFVEELRHRRNLVEKLLFQKKNKLMISLCSI